MKHRKNGSGNVRRRSLVSMVPYVLIVLQTIGMIGLLFAYYAGESSIQRHGPPAPKVTTLRHVSRVRVDLSEYNKIIAQVVETKDPVRDPVQRTFRFFGDPDVCNRYPWNFCYIQGNLRLVRKILKSYNWNEVKPEAESAQLTWSLADLADSKKYEFYHRLTPGTVVNHFPGIFELGNKKYLNINLKDYYNTFGEAFADFFPISFEVDNEMQQFKMAHEKLLSRQSDMDEAPMWVLKDPVGDRGEGVKVISGPQDLLHDDRRGLIVQQYIGNPYLLNGFKFTVRAYVSFQISLLELTLRKTFSHINTQIRTHHFVRSTSCLRVSKRLYSHGY